MIWLWPISAAFLAGYLLGLRDRTAMRQQDAIWRRGFRTRRITPEVASWN